MTTRRTQARRANRYVLYQQAVQAPDFEVEFFENRYRELRGKRPLLLREDFCGTALLCLEWCKSHPKRQAVGIDLCAETLTWGRRHNLQRTPPKVRQRIQLINANVLDISEPKADVTCAMNFSYCVFKTRDELRHYFETAHRGLNDNGIFFLDLLGGQDTMSIMKEERKIEGSDVMYIWDQTHFNPITHDFLCHIHFRFSDGSRLNRAFTYDWRLWTLPELQELLHEAGFKRVHIYWEEFEHDPNDDEYMVSTDRYIEATEVENQSAWITYIAAEV